MAHKVQMFTSSGCVFTGQPFQVDAIITDATAATHYNWEFKGSNGSWSCFTNGTNTINGQAFTVTGASASGPANDAPQLNIANATIALDGVLIRCLMRDNASPCGAPAGTVYGGDDLALNEVKTLRLKVVASAAICSVSCTDNVFTNTNGYYGGFEAITYNSSNNSFTDQNFLSGAGSSDYTTNGSGNGSFKVGNNPYAAYNTFGKFAPHSGNYQMAVKGNATANAKVWYKTVTVIPGQIYAFSVWASKVDNTAPKVQLKANGVELVAATLSSTIGAWQQLNGTYAIPAGVTSVTFAILDKDAATAAHNYVLDDICLVKTNDPVAIGDKVWFDINQDGAQDTNEPGVAGVTVKLFYDGNNDNNADSANPVQTAITNSIGIYTFNNVIAGNYFVQFTLPVGYTGFTTQNAAGIPVGQNSAVNVTTGKTGSHNFTADFLSKDAGLIKNLSVSGKALMDANGLADNIVNGTPVSVLSGVPLYANLFKGTVFISSVAVASGNYIFNNLPGNASYKVALSTVPATASSVPASVLPALWVNTGEVTGITAGNDSTVDGILTVAVSDIPVADVDFGVEQRPTAGTAATPPQINPGGTTSINVPASTFVSSDVAPGTVAAFNIPSFPANATSITVGTVTYYTNTSALPATCPTASCYAFPTTGGLNIAAPNGVITPVVKVDPLNGAVTVPILFVAIDNGNAKSAVTGTANVPFVVPDLTPNITAAPNVMHGTTTFNVTVAISEINNVGTQGLITVYIPKDSRVTFIWNHALGTIGSSPATPLNNAVWTYDGGTVFNDANGITDSIINGTGLNPGGLIAVLADNANNVVATAAVSSTGVYNFPNIEAGAYSIIVTTTNATIGSTIPAITLPANWVNTAEGITLAGDGNANGMIATVVGATAISNANFGMDRLPNSTSINTMASVPLPDAVFTLDGNSGNLPIPSGTDDEDGALQGGKTLVITTLVANANLLYNNNPVTLNQVITGFNPSLLKIQATVATVVAASSSFQFAYRDAAGKQDPTPATYLINWGLPLPIEMGDFTVVAENKSAVLNWNTLSENNNKGFEIERSADSKNWVTIGFENSKAVAGNSAENLSYTTIDQQPMNGINAYRLKQIDLNGNAIYSVIRQVKFNMASTIQLYPNPTTDFVNIQTSDWTTIAEVRLSDADGRLLYQNKDASKSISMNGLSPATYLLLIIKTDGTVTSFKVIKK